MEAKYVVGEVMTLVGVTTVAIVFPSMLNHKDVAVALKISATSAGMCIKDDSGNFCAYGESKSLGLTSSPDDNWELNRLGKDTL